jgi:hypothetical protein
VEFRTGKFRKYLSTIWLLVRSSTARQHDYSVVQNSAQKEKKKSRVCQSRTEKGDWKLGSALGRIRTPAVEGGDGPLVDFPLSPISSLSVRYIGHRAVYLFRTYTCQNITLFTPEPPSSPRPVTRVLYREYVASEDIPPEPQFIAQTEPFRPAPVLYAHTAYSPISFRFLFYASTTFRDLLVDFLLHPCTPFPGRPTHIAVYQRRTQFFHTASHLNPHQQYFISRG